MMRLVINGIPQDYEGTPELESLLKALEYGTESRGIAVAINNTVVPRRDISRVVLKDGDRIEIIEAVQGG
ncbi:MAG: sulfur carrier protein ThiS [Candidatus Eisenbacteria bacterium]|uniref:Sulfur carrier protein ThiS n=1 Tax=Eiseniibacteriota bacterium TaxID=2212470 RepID=A0A948RTW5_UNCEI|nr:sulfur carrier protein ThiS [Candidatus Eisenbacteria bacterium]MBU1950532.1 sulfur carrier protein ThiS [Candidatus Eisenbacteria bacterium]MBU2690933.1 sulfur carrier protein ThiS [Candidatus Eisenbacteria bacterium]